MIFYDFRGYCLKPSQAFMHLKGFGLLTNQSSKQKDHVDDNTFGNSCDDTHTKNIFDFTS